MLQLGTILDHIVRSGHLPARRAACAALSRRVLGAPFDERGKPREFVGPSADANPYRAAFEEMARVWERRIDSHAHLQRRGAP